ncbi:MAG: hypothetical protein JWN70_7163 [Planctomycetaceae bacterium]|nr:hypothetical protein [Planctomycetaceae bacterium]
MFRELTPPTKLSTRIIILVVMLVPLLIIPGMEWWARILSCTMPLIFTGTYRISKIIETRFETRFHFAFIPFPLQKCKLATVGSIETTYGTSQAGIWTYIMFGPLQLVLSWVFDYLIPSLGGPYEIWLVTAKGREIKAWQGFNQDYFDANLKLLQEHTTAELKTRVGA